MRKAKIVGLFVLMLALSSATIHSQDAASVAPVPVVVAPTPALVAAPAPAAPLAAVVTAVASEPSLLQNIGSLDFWVKTLAMIFGTLWSLWLLPFLKGKVAAQKQDMQLNAAKYAIDTSKSLVEQKGALLAQAKLFAEEHALSIANTNFPKLAADIASGKYKDPGFVKAVLYSWGQGLENDMVAYFKTSNIDIIAVLGQKTVDTLIDSAAAKVSPFPGKDVAVEMLESNVVPMLLNYGVNWVRTHYLGGHSDTEIARAQTAGLLPVEQPVDFNKIIAATTSLNMIQHAASAA